MTRVQISGLCDRERARVFQPGLSDLAICWPGSVGLPGQGQVCVPALDLSRGWWGEGVVVGKGTEPLDRAWSAWGGPIWEGGGLEKRGYQLGGQIEPEILAWVGGVSWAGWGVGTE